MTTALSFALIACSSTGAPPGAHIPSATDLQLLTLPRDPDAVALTAQMTGTLAAEDGCVVVRTSDATLRVALPHTFALWLHDGVALGVRDTTNQQRFRFGTRVVLGGGLVDVLPGYVDASASTRCPPPYFAISDVRPET